MTNPLTFFDTNILVYADDVSSAAKRRKATELIASHLAANTAVFSLQVLQEYFSAATRKLRVTPQAAQEKIEVLVRAKIVRLDESDLIQAIEMHRLRGIGFWDSLIVQAAMSAGCGIIYSEDELGGGRIGKMRVVNPFR